MIEHGIDKGLIRPRARSAYHVAETVQEAIDFLARPMPATVQLTLPPVPSAAVE